ncbi:MAG: ADOP family duplicated permease [Vicinamibacterales bacterium]
MTRRTPAARLLALAARHAGARLGARFGDEPAETMAALAADARARGGRLAEAAYVARELLALARVLAHRAGPPARHPGGSTMIDALLDDLRWTARLARRRPLATLTVVATLAATIAAAATTYGVASAVLWRPLPYRDAGRLVLAWEAVDFGQGTAPGRVTSGRYADWRDHARLLSSMAAFAASSAALETPDGAIAIRGVRVTASYFETLGVAPALGRAFLPEDARPGRDKVVVLSHAFWQRQFGGRASVVGESVRLDGEPFTVIGVMPPVVFPAWPVNPARVTLAPDEREYWVPIARTPQFDRQSLSHLYGVVARLGPGVSLEAAEAELASLASPDEADPHAAALRPLREQFVTDARVPLLTLLASALALLLVACANLAAVQVTVMEARRGELAVRSAIGAGRWRLVRQLLTESLALAVVGGTVGLLLTRAALASVPALLPPTVPLLTAPVLDWRVAVFGAGAAVACGLLVSAWPVTRVSGRRPAPRGVSSGPRGAIYRALVIAQVAVTVALVAAAGLLAQSLWSIRGRDAGFAVDDVLVADLGLPDTRYGTPRAVVGFEDLVLARVAALPGVRGAALAYDHPLESNWSNSYTIVGDVGRGDTGASATAELRIVSPGYFESLGVELLDGRLPGVRDDIDSPGVVVVNEAFARSAGFAPVVGRTLLSAPPRFTWGDSVPASFEIVGIVEDERFRGLESPSLPAVYMSTRQFPQVQATIVVRTTVAPAALTGAVRGAIREVDTGVTFSSARPLGDILDEQLVTRQVTTDVVGGLAGVALALAALGLYGLLVVAVAARAREFGVRLALGAEPGALARRVVGDGVRDAAIGIGVGLLLAAAAGRVLESLLVDVGASDIPTLAAVSCILLLVAGAATVGPARRAASIDPARALRGD